MERTEADIVIYNIMEKRERFIEALQDAKDDIFTMYRIDDAIESVQVAADEAIIVVQESIDLD